MASGLASALKRRAAPAAALALLLAAGLWLAASPRAVILGPDRGASWIGFPEPLWLGTRAWADEVVYLRRRFTVAAGSGGAVELRALRSAQVRLDGRVILSTDDPRRWRQSGSAALEYPGPGEHELFVTVFNRGGPALARAAVRGWGLSTGPDWEASRDGRLWRAAWSAARPARIELSRRFPAAGAAILGRLPALASVFLLACLWVWCLETGQGPAWLARAAPGPGGWRWILLGAWALLAANNLPKVPFHVGFDVGAHMDYISYVAGRWRIPLATEGWQMFQAPLYYLLSAPFHALGMRLLDEAAAARLLRLLPLLCGAVQVELALRALRLVYPRRRDLQIFGTVLAGLLPMNLYLAQAVSNEGLCAALCAAAIVWTWSLTDVPRRTALGIGGVLGAALLAKVTAILLVAPLAAFAAAAWPRRRVAGALALLLGAAAAVAGWYYLRTWLVLGRPFVGGWDPARGLAWWQDPGFRTWNGLWSWGEALRRPVYSCFSGFWDGLYSTFWLDGNLSGVISFENRPPWDYDYMVCGAWLGLLPTAAILTGIVAAIFSGRSAQRPYLRFSAACLGIYLAALVYLWASVPAYSAVKATYTLGLLPCYAALAAAGFDLFLRGPWSRALVAGGMACWGAAAYLAYLAR